MRTFILVVLTVARMSSIAQAETFICLGTGRFFQIAKQQVKLEWKKQYQQVLIETDALKVQVYIDKSNSDGSSYVGIEVLELNEWGATSIRGAKGSIKDLVQFLDSASSQVSCLPLAE